MSKVTVEAIKKLRQMTGAGMMDCKKALQEANGDFEKAIEILRKKGQKILSSRSDKKTAEGYIKVWQSEDKTKAIAVALLCETDFVARNKEFQEGVEAILQAAVQHQPENKEALLKSQTPEGITVEEKIIELAGKIGEKITLGAYEVLEGAYVSAYVHHGNKLAALVAFENVNGVENIDQVGKEIAMQVVAMNPIAVDENSVPEEILKKEREIARERALQQGKPEHIVDRIVDGMLKKFFKENTLLQQEFIGDDKKSVAQFLKSVSPNLKVTAFKRIQIG